MPDSTELSEREQEILQLVATGASNKEIAQRLTISANTVKVHLRNIFAKIGAVSRTEAAMYAVKAGLVPGAAPAAEEANPLAIPRPAAAPAAPTGRRSLLFAIVLGIIFLGALALGTLRLLSQNAQPVPTIPATAEPLWQVYPQIPQPRSGLAGAVYEGRVYAIGGETGDGVSGLVQRYDPARQTWQDLKPKPTAASDIQAAVLGGRIYIPGGRTASGASTDVMEIYDPRLDDWVQGAPLPDALSAYALAAFEGKLYLFGGWDGEQILDSVYRYDPALDAWETLPPMPTRRAYAGAAVAGGEIYVLGGTSDEGVVPVSEVFAPDLAEDGESSWSDGVPMPEKRTGMGVASVADTIYVMGGAGEALEFPALAFFPQTGEWQSLETPPQALGARLGLVSLGTSLFALGGVEGNTPLGNNLAYKAMYTISIPLITK